jgi:penicillin amidase
LSGKLTASGKPLLANDTHLEWGFPGPWYSLHLQSPELHVAGFSLPGLPLVIIGHNERIAWGITNLHFDVQDLYLENMDPRTGRYVYKGQLEQARPEQETIRVKDGRNVELTVWVTRHGPIFQSLGNSHFAIRWTGAEPNGFAYPFLEVGQAKNWEEFVKALSRVTGPGSNVLYADVDGNIGYHAVGRMPVRTTYFGDLPTQGALGASEWDGYIPFEELPSAYNPPSGMLITANQNPFPAAYKYRVNGNFSAPYRSRQIESLLKAKQGWKAEELLRVQTDVYSAFSHRLAREGYQVWEKRGQKNPEMKEPAELLKNWDGQMQVGQAAPLIVTLVFQHLRKAVADKASGGQGPAYETQMAPVALEKLLATRPAAWFNDFDGLLLKCFADGLEEGKRLQGSNVKKWDYGKYTEFALQHPVVSRVPYIGRYFNIGPMPMSGSSTTVKQTTRRLGPSMRFIADLSDWEKSLHSVTIGQSGQPFSPHFKDQWKEYYAGRAFPMGFGKAAATGVLEVVPK